MIIDSKGGVQMARIKAESGEKVHRLEEKVAAQEKENAPLKESNRFLTDKNARLKSIPDNDSLNTFLPHPPTRSLLRTNTTSAQPRRGKVGARARHRERIVTTDEIRERIRTGRRRHAAREIGNVTSGRQAAARSAMKGWYGIGERV